MIKPQLIIKFLSIKNSENYNYIKIFGKTYDVNPMNFLEIDIPYELFKEEKEKIIIDIILISLDDDEKKIIFNYNAYYGINKAYCFTDIASNLKLKALFELCFYNGKIDIKIDKNNITEADSFDDSNRQRITLINIDKNQYLEEINRYLNDYIPLSLRDFNSFQISIFNHKYHYYSSKVIKEENDFSFVKAIENKKNILEQFYASLIDLTNKQTNNSDNYIKLIKKYDIEIIENINFSQKKNILKKEFEIENIYYYIYLYYLYYSLYICLVYNKEKNVLKGLDIYNYINNFYNIYLKDNDLLTFQKVILFISNTIFFLHQNNIKKYDSMNLQYIKKKDIKEKSVFGCCFKFINNFIEKLNTQSLLFYPLLLLDSGKSYFYEKEIYCFNMEPIKVIKAHLQDLIPDVFFIYHEKSVNQEHYHEKGFNYKGYQCIFLNIETLIENFQFDLKTYEYKNKEEEKIIKNNSIRVSKTLFHESFAHNKFIFSFSSCQSPTLFFNHDNDLIEIVPTNSEKSGPNILKASNCENKGESGKFLEYFFGMYESSLVIDLIFKIDNPYKLIDNIDYFVHKNLDMIKNYIIYKYIIKTRGIDFSDKDDKTLEDDVNEMIKIIKEYEKKKNVNLLIKKKTLPRPFLYNKINLNNNIIYQFKNITKSNNENIGYDKCLQKIR